MSSNIKKNSYIIAEAGINHNGSLDIAKLLVDAACKAGADAVKFQTFSAEKLVTPSAKKAEYQKNLGGQAESQLEMLKALELTEADYINLQNYSFSMGIQFLSTAFDLDSLKTLGKLDLPVFKIPSGEITNYPLLVETAKLGKPIILSTGMATLGEIGGALDVLERNGVEREAITILHCTTAYPTPLDDVNLLAMLTLREKFKGVQIGYSDHTQGTTISVAAVALGAQVIEKHFTLDRSMKGPDHQASLEPGELKQMVVAIREVEEALGDAEKKPVDSEIPNLLAARKSLVASCKIAKGELFTATNITAKRPGGGLSPMKWPEVIGKISSYSFSVDDKIKL